MLISIDELKEIYADKDFSRFNETRLKWKLESIEKAIREYTHNSFQNRNIRTKVNSFRGICKGDMSLFKKGDTVQISYGVNTGLYVIEEVTEGHCTLDKALYDDMDMVMTKVEYPLDVIDGCIELLDYSMNYQSNAKRGIASESLSRHSVSYKGYDESNTINGYPSEMFGFLKKYVEWQT